MRMLHGMRMRREGYAKVEDELKGIMLQFKVTYIHQKVLIHIPSYYQACFFLFSFLVSFFFFPGVNIIPSCFFKNKMKISKCLLILIYHKLCITRLSLIYINNIFGWRKKKIEGRMEDRELVKDFTHVV